MEQAPTSHREKYETIEQDIDLVKSKITGEKTKEEIATLVEERERLIAELDAEKNQAEDAAREDDANLDDARERIEKLTAEIEQYKDQIAGITGITKEEREKGASPEDLAETATRLKEAGYLDASFDGKKFHRLEMRPLTKEEAISEYRTSGGETSVWYELEKNMSNTVPKAETLYVMIMNFGKDISCDEALAEMDKLGVRPLNSEELIQYGIANPDHQEQKTLVELGTKYTLGGKPKVLVLYFDNDDDGEDEDERVLSTMDWDGNCDGRFRFLVVSK